MTYLIVGLLLLTIWLCVCTLGLSKRVLNLEESMPAKIDNARDEGWLDGYQYQVALEKSRHPRAINGQFAPKSE